MPRIKQLIKIGNGIGVELEMPIEAEGSLTIYDAAELEQFRKQIDRNARKEGFTAGQISMQLDCESAALAHGFRLPKVPIRHIKALEPQE